MTTETMASANTSLRWVQISRDFDFVRIVGEEEKGDRPVGRPHLARDFVARAAVDRKKITFDLINGAAGVAVCPSILGNPYPVHVHRHIGLITTRYLPELGRPVEVFCRTALAGGQATELPGDPAGDEQAVRVVEFETPAAVLCDKELPAVPQAYRSSYFDLVATGYRKDNDIVLTVRFVGSAAHLAAFKALTVRIRQPGPDARRDVSLEVSVDLAKPKVPVAGLRLILRPGSGLFETWTLHADGTQVMPAKAQPIGQVLDLSGASPGFWLELGVERRKADGKEEFWADASLLHCRTTSTARGGDAAPKAAGSNDASPKLGKDGQAIPAGPALAFDFDWLFAPPQEGEAAAMVSPSGLNAMVEAQARIVSVSPPIPIVRQ